MYLAIFLADFAVFRVSLGISRDFAEVPEFRGSAFARNIRSPVLRRRSESTVYVCFGLVCGILSYIEVNDFGIAKIH